ncbi:MAG: cation:proton antiporter [Slackia sp.]
MSFQFAIAALTTGFLLDATASFVVSFFGGIGLGLGILAFFVSRVRDFGLEDTTFHVLLEVLTPFFVFLIAEEVHVSGILAVVAAGLSYSFFNRSIGPNIARMKIVSTSVWKVLAFILNGIVFVLLGVQLPYAMSDMWEERSVSNPELIALVLALSAAVIGVRMLWFLALNYIGRKQRAHGKQKNSGGSPDR